MDVSIIIPVSRFEETRRCLESLAHQTYDKGSFEVVLVSAHDLTGLVLPEVSFQVTPLPVAENHPSKMRNQAVAQSSGTLLGFLDDDTVVPANWVADVAGILGEHPERIVGGPNVDRRASFACALANAVQEHPLLEGLKNHQELCGDAVPTTPHNLPLSNVAMHRDTFMRVGGFNEVANYFMDGSEFFYIASRLHIPMYLYACLTIQHDYRPMFLPYFKYKFRARRMIGGNFVLFPECYAEAGPIRLLFAALLALPFVLTLLLATGQGSLLGWAAGVYLCLLYAGGLYAGGRAVVKRPLLYVLQAPCVMIAQVLMFCGFMAGFMNGVCTVRSNLGVIDHKLQRYKTFAGDDD